MEELEAAQRIRELEQAIEAQEGLRESLGSTVVDATVQALRQKVASLRAASEEAAAERLSTHAPSRRPATIVFADVSGFTALSETLEPDQVRDVMNACFQELVPVIRRHGGTVDKFIGDEIMAVFGAPIAHEDDAARALRACLDLMAGIRAFSERQQHALNLHIGVNTGMVVSGSVGSAERSDWSVLGDAVNVAARLEGAAENGVILVGETTVAAAGEGFRYGEPRQLELKGKSRPVTVRPLLGLDEAVAQVIPLEGREVERRVLDGALAGLELGRGGLTWLEGAAGQGKSRLVAELRAGARVAFLEARCQEQTRSQAWSCFTDLLVRFSGAAHQDDHVEALRRIRARLEPLGAPSQDLIHCAALLLGPEASRGEGALERFADPESVRAFIFRTAGELLAALVGERPTVLVFEDVHWCDDSSLALVQHLLPAARGRPLHLICATRPSSRAEVLALREQVDELGGQRIVLDAISPAAVEALAGSVLGGRLSPQLRDLIVQRAEGNPFYVIELSRALQAVGAVRLQDQRLHVDVDDLAAVLPSSLQGAILARVDRLDDELRQLLALAAVIGRQFLYRVLRRLNELGEEQLDPSLAQLEALALVRERMQQPDRTYAFNHALVQEAVYDSVVTAERRRLHAEVARAVETLFSDRLEDFHGVLALHYARAEVWDKAQQHLLAAGDNAGRMAADDEALWMYRQALEICERSGGQRWSADERAVVERKIAEALFRSGRHEEAVAVVRRCLQHWGRSWPERGWKAWAAILWELGKQLLPWRRRVPVGQGEVPQSVVERCVLHTVLAWCQYFLAPELFLLASLRMLNDAEPCGYAPGVVPGSTAMAIASLEIGIPSLAPRYVALTREAAEADGRPEFIAYAHLVEGISLLDRGELTSAGQSFRQSSEAFWEVGNIRGWGVARARTTAVREYSARMAEDLEACRETIARGVASRDGQCAAFGHQGCMVAHSHSGHFEEMRGDLEHAVAWFEALPDYLSVASANVGAAVGATVVGRMEQARAWAERARSLVLEHGLSGPMAVHVHCCYAEVLLLRAEEGEPIDGGALATACRAATRAAKRVKVSQPDALRAQGMLAFQSGDAPRGKEELRRSIELATDMGAECAALRGRAELALRLGDRHGLDAVITELNERGMGGFVQLYERRWGALRGVNGR